MNLIEDKLEAGRPNIEDKIIQKTVSGYSAELVPSIFSSHGQFA